MCALVYQAAQAVPLQLARSVEMTPDTTGRALDVLWDSARQTGDVDDYVECVLSTVKDQCGLRRDPAAPQGAKRARTGADVTVDALADALGGLKLQDYNCSLDFLGDAMKYVATGIMQKSTTQRLLGIVDHFPHQPQSGNWFRQRLAWALVEIAPSEIKRQLSVALAEQNYQDDPQLVAEIAFHQDTVEEAVLLACAFVKQGYVYPNFFKCGCCGNDACADGWNNESKRWGHCLLNYELAIHSALAHDMPVSGDDDF